MTHEQAIAEAERRRAADPSVTWVATQRAGEWVLARIGVARVGQTGTATKPPPVAPRADPHTPLERATWTAGTG